MVSGTDLPTVLLWGGVGLVVLSAVVALLAWDARRRRSPSVLLDVIAAMSRMWVAIVILGMAVTIIRWISSDSTEVASLPIWLAWPEDLPCQSIEAAPAGEGAVLQCAGISSAHATITGLEGPVRALLGAGSVLSLLVAGIPGLVVAVLSQRAVAGAPFAARTARWLLTSAIVILVAGTLGSLLTDLGGFLAAQAVLADPSADASLTAPRSFSFSPPAWPLGVALGLGALSVIFRQGARLQNDVKGLV